MRQDGSKTNKVARAPKKIDYEGLLRNTIIGCSTVVIDKEIVGEFSMPLVRRGQDTATWLQLLKKEKYAYGIQEDLVNYRLVGNVGLVTGVCLAEVGNENVVCVDVDEQKVKSMKLGIAPIYEEGLEELMVKNYNRGRIDYTTDYKKAYEDVDVILIAVGTPERSDGSANLDYIKAVAKQIAEIET